MGGREDGEVGMVNTERRLEGRGVGDGVVSTGRRTREGDVGIVSTEGGLEGKGWGRGVGGHYRKD